jgi:DUF438 domain-containing protein
MSEFIKNREEKQTKLKEIIRELHAGKGVEEVKQRFADLIKGVSAGEIAEMEQALVAEGMPVEEIQRLCDVHARVFEGSVEQIHKTPQEAKEHPIELFRLENRKLEAFIEKELLDHLQQFVSSGKQEDKAVLTNDIEKLASIDRHYSRKENLVFPYMEKHGITAPPKVMWGIDDEIRQEIRDIKEALVVEHVDIQKLDDMIKQTVIKINEMIYKEENIMFPMITEVFTQEEWESISRSEEEIGYTMIPGRKKKYQQSSEVKRSRETSDEVIFDAGSMTQEEVNALLNTVPFDMTFVDSKDRVKYFTQGKERIFDRPRTIIGREVRNCHPPASVHVVNKILESFKNGEKDNEDFWIKMGDRFVYIRYFAVRNDKNEYLGTLEVTQDIKPLRDLSGEKRIMDGV